MYFVCRKNKTNIFIDICKSISNILIQHFKTNLKDHQEIAQKKIIKKVPTKTHSIDTQWLHKKRLPTYKSIRYSSWCYILQKGSHDKNVKEKQYLVIQKRDVQPIIARQLIKARLYMSQLYKQRHIQRGGEYIINRV
jgi:hypothetical protein